MSCDPQWQSRVDAVLVGGVAASEWRAWRSHVRDCNACRASYDELAPAIAYLERGECPAEAMAHFEAELLAAVKPASTPWAWTGAAFVTAAAAAVLVAILWPTQSELSDEVLTMRGGASEALGFRVYCLAMDEAGAASVRASASTSSDGPAACALSDRVQLSYSLAPEETGSFYVALFGLGPDGQIVVYWPRPGTPAPAAPGRDVLLPGSFEAKVAHAPGEWQIFGVLTKEPRTAEEIRDGEARRAEGPAARIHFGGAEDDD